MKIYFLCSLLLLSFGLSAQNCLETLNVKVTDAHTGEHVAFARISVAGKREQFTADSLGNVTITKLCRDTFVLVCVPHFGCEPVETVVTYPFPQILQFSVEVHPELLDEAVVFAYRFRRESQARSQVDPLDLSRISGNTLGDQLKRIAGVTSLNTGSGIVKPVLNGLHSNRIVVVNNGIRQEGQQWGSEHAPEIDPNLAAKLEVIQGASGLQYGPDAIGGVILVEPEELRYNKPAAGWVKANAFSNGLGGGMAGLLNGSLTRSGNFAYRVHASGRMNGTLSTPDYLLKNTASNEYSFSGAFGYRGKKIEAEGFYSDFTTRLGIFTGSHIGNLTDLMQAFEGGRPKEEGKFTYAINNPHQLVRHRLSKLKLVYNWSEKIKTTVTGGYQFNLRQEYDNHKSYNDSIEALGLPDFELNLWTQTLDFTTEFRHTKRFTSKIGGSLFKQDNAYSGRFFIPNFQKFQSGAFYLFDYRGKLWQLDGGVRYDISQLDVYYYKNGVLVTPKKQWNHISYAAGASRIIGHHWIARVNAGSSWRPPSVNELYSNGLHHGAASIEQGTESLKKEVSYQLQTSVQYRSAFGNFEIAGFYNHMSGYINLLPVSPPQLTIVGAFPVFRYGQSDVVLSGINLTGEVNIRKWLKYGVQGSLLNAVDKSTDSLIFGVPYNRLTNRLRAEFNIKNNWSFFSEIEGMSVFARTRAISGRDYVDPPAGYFLLNAGAGFIKKINDEQSMHIVLNVSNLANYSYRDYMNRFRYFADETGRNISIRILVPFMINKKSKQL